MFNEGAGKKIFIDVLRSAKDVYLGQMPETLPCKYCGKSLFWDEKRQVYKHRANQIHCCGVA